MEREMLYAIAFVLLALWLLGFILDAVGGIIHILLVAGFALLVYRFIAGTRT
jgi:hypothetical protein